MKLFATRASAAAAACENLVPAYWLGRLTSASSYGSAVLGLAQHLSLGDRLLIQGRHGASTRAEIIAVRDGVIHAMFFAAITGVGAGLAASAPIEEWPSGLMIADDWVGRVVDPLGHPLDGRVEISRGSRPRPVRSSPPEATRRERLGERVCLGVRALDLFVTCRHGQRIGLFAGSGVGKSSLLAMLARNGSCDVCVIALVGERGREVREFLEDELGPNGRAKSVTVVATSDASPLMRREAAYAAMTVAEYFREAGRKVLLVMDSVTRFCHALREIALAAGEPPASRGYPPSVFAELPRLLERAGPGPQTSAPGGQITAFFTVLVEGDDLNEPVADSARGLLDGHVVLDRQIAERGRFPAVDVLRSLSRAVPGCNTPSEVQLTLDARQTLAKYTEIVDLVRLGAYRSGGDAAADRALAIAPRIDALLRQSREECPAIAESFQKLELAMQ
jgi:flagellum-specific ATP synthase